MPPVVLKLFTRLNFTLVHLKKKDLIWISIVHDLITQLCMLSSFHVCNSTVRHRSFDAQLVLTVSLLGTAPTVS